MYTPNQRVKIVQSTNTLLAEHTEDVGKFGIILAVDHPAAGIAGSVTVVVDPCHNGLGRMESRKLRFFDYSQVELQEAHPLPKRF